MIVEQAQLVNLGGSLSDFSLSLGQILAVLPATRITAEGRSEKGQGPADSLLLHVLKCVGQKRVPVSISKIHRQIDLLESQLFSESLNQSEVLFIDGTLAPEMIVVLRHRFESLARNAAPSGHVLQKRHNVIGFVGPPKRNNDEGLIG